MEEQQIVNFLTSEELFYSKELHFSYSALKKLLWSPKAYYNYYVLGQKQDKISKELIEGKIIHCLLLNNGEFDKLFIISPINIPVGNNKIIVDRLFYHHSELVRSEVNTEDFYNSHFGYGLKEYSLAIIDILTDVGLHQTLKTNQQRIDKILSEENINYFEYLKIKGTRDVVDQETYDYCKSQAELLKQDKFISKIMGMDPEFDEIIDVINETQFSCNITNKNFGLKGIIDNLVINHSKKIIYINDIKTTSKNIIDFKESVEFYQYWLQAIIYHTLVVNNYINLLTIESYKIEFRFIVIDQNKQFYPFKVSDKTFNEWFNKLKEVLNKADYHYTNKKYNLPYELCNGLVEL